MEPSNILKIESLNDQWHDKDTVLLHASFQLLKDAVEKENLLTGHTDWSFDDKYRKAKKEIQELYDWWSNFKDIDRDSLDPESYELQNQMLVRLINIRWALWT